MEDHKPTSYTFEIDNFSQKESKIASPNFLSGGCEWFVQVHPKGDHIEDHLALFLYVANSESLRLGWKRRANFFFVLLDQSGKELYKTKELLCKLFCAQVPGWGFPKAVLLKMLQEKGLFTKHPDIAVNLKPKSQFVKTTYMNLLLGLIETLNKPPHSFSETELSNARRELMDLTEASFKLDWLKTKLDEVSLERKKASADSIRVRELEEQVKNLKAELNKEKEKSATSAAKVLSLEKTVSDIIEQNKKLFKALCNSTANFGILFTNFGISEQKPENSMEDQKQTSFTFEIDNFSEKEGVIQSPNFLSGGCEWCLRVHPKGDYIEDHLALYLSVSNPESLRLGWKRRASFSFVLLNQSGNVLRTDEKLFCAEFLGWGWARALPLEKLQEKGLFLEHPDIAVNFRPKSQLVKTTYMDLLLGLIETLNKPPHGLSETELSNARSELIDLTEAGFKLDWLKTKLDEVSLERKKASADGSGVQEFEKQVKNMKLELDTEKVKSATCAAKVLSLEQEVSDLKDELNKKEGQTVTPKDFLKYLVNSWKRRV
ncbi:unnamed protein product, partial [Thlaspi arvense]